MRVATFQADPSLKNRVLHWAAGFPCAAFADNGSTPTDRYGEFEFMAGVSSKSSSVLTGGTADLKKIKKSGKWWFGGLSYELRTQVEPILKEEKKPTVDFAPVQFFEAETVVLCRRNSTVVEIHAADPEAVFAQIIQAETSKVSLENFTGFESDFTREEYIRTVEKLQWHIREGDCYEINFCRHFIAGGKLTAPAAVFEALMKISPVPFGMFLKMGDTFVLSASPERFLRHSAGHLITQPIKGTAARGATPEEDLVHIHELKNSLKEQAENVMIVDLSRNDLHRSCLTGSVKVPHLFEVQTFAQVHQLVSTVTGTLNPEVDAADALLACFPPGSMTGAPKVKVCGLIGEYEKSARGLYAGALGYFDPLGNFDLNVVIRTLLYDARTEKLSFHTGGAITHDSDPAKEWQETVVKAQAITNLFDLLIR